MPNEKVEKLTEVAKLCRDAVKSDGDDLDVGVAEDAIREYASNYLGLMTQEEWTDGEAAAAEAKMDALD